MSEEETQTDIMRQTVVRSESWRGGGIIDTEEDREKKMEVDSW